MVASFQGSNPAPRVSSGFFRDELSDDSLDDDKVSRIFRVSIALICILFCVAFVPDQPGQLASICERHHSAEACQVW